MQSYTASGQLHRTRAAPSVFTQHIINYRTGKLWATPVQEKVCKGHSTSFSFGKDTAFVSSLVSVLQCQLHVFFLTKEVQTRWTAPHQCGPGTNEVEVGSPANILACMLELSDFVFSLIPDNEVRELPAWTRQPGYTADFLTCFSPGLLLSCQ